MLGVMSWRRRTLTTYIEANGSANVEWRHLVLSGNSTYRNYLGYSTAVLRKVAPSWTGDSA